MEEYTWDEIINNPRSKRAKACVGKEVYFAYTPLNCLKYANNHNYAFLDVLKEINPESCISFYSRDGLKSPYIIPKKEEPKPEPKYVPFKNIREFIREFVSNTPIMHVYRLWIYEKIGYFDEKVPRLVTEMWGDGVIVGSDSHTTKWKDLLERFVFENNKPCGKLQEEK